MAGESRDLLLEIGVEELPARECPPALDQLGAKAAAMLEEARLHHGSIDTFGTPRRLVLLVRDLAMRQEDREALIRGPSRKVAFDAEGRPTKAAEGFARSQGVAAHDLVVRQDEKGGEYVYAVRREEGQSVAVVLPPLLERLILSLEFSRSMRWGDRAIRFARPIRWVLALLGNTRVPLRLDGLESVATTRGHRTLGQADPVTVTSVQDYFAKVAQQYVMVDPVIRRRHIWHQVQSLARDLGGFTPEDPDLLEEVNWLVEQPTAFAGSFDPVYLALPPEVLVTVMRHHQRYFPVWKQEGELLPHFIAVRNGGEDFLDQVRAGNEKVLRARLADARFFFEEDRRRTLESRLDDLRKMVFQEGLGTLHDKAGRLARLAGTLADAAGLSAGDRERAVTAARLAKCDLATHMVYEFPELQGVMGREYARLEGLDPAVATALYEHYLPRGAGDALPRTAVGAVVGVADRLDTLAGFFCLGLVPTGSQDPYALRRAAQGVVAILAEFALPLDLLVAVDAAFAGYEQFDGPTRARARDDLLEFFRARLEALLRERGHRYDAAQAVLAAGYANVPDALRRADALSRSLEQPDFAAVTGAFKRVANLATKGADEGAVRPDDPVRPELFQEEPEQALWQAFLGLREAAEAALARQDYEGFYRVATQLKGPVDAFLDRVLVMAEDPAVRTNRLALLREIAGLLTRPAALGRLAVG